MANFVFLEGFLACLDKCKRHLSHDIIQTLCSSLTRLNSKTEEKWKERVRATPDHTHRLLRQSSVRPRGIENEGTVCK